MARYVEPKELFNEIIASKEKGQLTDRAVEILMLMTRKIATIFQYKYEEDREDCISFAMEDVIKYWNRFDPAKSNNAFAFYTQMIKNGFAKGWRRLYPIKASLKVSLSGDSGISNLF